MSLITLTMAPSSTLTTVCSSVIHYLSIIGSAHLFGLVKITVLSIFGLLIYSWTFSKSHIILIIKDIKPSRKGSLPPIILLLWEWKGRVRLHLSGHLTTGVFLTHLYWNVLNQIHQHSSLVPQPLDQERICFFMNADNTLLIMNLCLKLKKNKGTQLDVLVWAHERDITLDVEPA